MRVQADLVEQLFNSSEKRLARILLLMAEFGEPGEPEQYIPRITQETLAIPRELLHESLPQIGCYRIQRPHPSSLVAAKWCPRRSTSGRQCLTASIYKHSRK
jgi:hypothetical protein